MSSYDVVVPQVEFEWRVVVPSWPLRFEMLRCDLCRFEQVHYEQSEQGF